MKSIKLLSYLFFILIVNTSVKSQIWQIEPDEYLSLAFEDSTGAKDTINVGFYNDPNYWTGNAIVSLGVDASFGEINMPIEITDTIFTARSERRFGDAVPYDSILSETFLKNDIIFNNELCQYYTVAPYPDFIVRFYNYKLPIKFNVTIHQGTEYQSENYFGCFCSKPVETSWSWRVVPSCNESGIFGYEPFKFSDTISCQQLEYLAIDVFRFTVGFKEFLNTNGVIVYPIPAEQLLAINSDININNIQIFDCSGRKVFEDYNKDISYIDVSSYSQGIYFVRLITPESKIVISKFIKQ